MRYLSVCSGIEAASVAWATLGWHPVAFSEIEAFPSAVLAERHPGVPNWGDMTKFKDAPRREAWQGIAERAKDGPGDRRWPAVVAPTLNATYADKWGLEDQNALSGGGIFVPDYANSLQGWAVRRLTHTECERLQGFPDGYTAITYRDKPAADGPRYKALGNSMAVNVMRWIGRRIELVSSVLQSRVAA